MKEMRTLRVLDRFAGLFERVGVDYAVMRRILQVKLTMDGRRVPVLSGGSKKNQQDTPDESNQFLRSLWLYVLFGGFSSVLLLAGDNYIFQTSLLFGIMMFMIMTSMISDFSTVLLDIRDRNILATKPVSKRTITMAKMIHIFIYLFFITGAVAIIPLAVGLVKHGILFLLIFLLELILMNLLIVVLTALLYLTVLRLFDGEKLKDIINYVQIGLTIAITVGYQVLIRLFDFTAIDIAFKPAWWQVLLPPAWAGAAFQVLLRPGTATDAFIGLAVLSVVVPLVAFFVYLKLMPALERNLQKLAEPDSRSESKGGGVVRRIANLLCSTPQERAFFRFAWTMLGTERDFKLKVYPTLGFSIIFPFIFLFSGNFQWDNMGSSESRAYLLIYFSGMMLPTIIKMLGYSSQYKAAWIYYTAPLENMNPAYKGTLLACLIRLMLPLFIFQAVVFTVLFGAGILPDLIIVGVALQFYAIMSFLVISKGLPFSAPFESMQQQSGFLRNMGLLLFLGVLALLHLAALLIPYGAIIYGVLLIAVTWAGWRKAFSLVK
ncbi:hypothetical protein [Paenibacillus sanguinis]|uniref:hypothetical protein n=1 Tax=Paenibacillus sanguinis TaxID=225906 RepID=UPI0003659118|nr:hypothetical protein [Paenibacillus sanguinis]